MMVEDEGPHEEVMLEEVPEEELDVMPVEEREMGIIETITHNIKAFLYPIIIVSWLVLLFFAPSRKLFFYFSLFFFFVIRWAMKKLLDTKNILAVDLENSVCAAWEVSSQHFNRFDILDDSGKESAPKWTLEGLTGEVIIANAYDPVSKTVVINQICSNLHFVNKIKDRVVKLSKKATERMHEITRLRSDREYETLESAFQLYKKHPVLRLINQEEEEQAKEKEREEKKDLEEPLSEEMTGGQILIEESEDERSVRVG